MVVKIAVATASGKAFYQLVSELKRRNIPFITIRPSDTIPLNIKVAITTLAEKDAIKCSSVLIYDETKDPSIVIDEALQILRGKTNFKNIILGIDPGKESGIAVIGDGVILEINNLSSDEIKTEVQRIMKRFQSEKKIVKIGNGAVSYQSKIIRVLDRILPPEVNIELVKEDGTSKNLELLFGRNFKNAASAVKISMRRGVKKRRKKGLL